MEKGQSEPYVLVIGTYQEPQQGFLIVDSEIITEVDKGVPHNSLSHYNS